MVAGGGLQVACGSTSSFACMLGGALACWGKLKVSGDNTMYPKPFFELQGWTIRHMACGNATFAVAAQYQDPHKPGGSIDRSTITWWVGHTLSPSVEKEGCAEAGSRV